MTRFSKVGRPRLLSREQKALLKSVFRYIDTDKDAHLSLREVFTAARLLAITLPPDLKPDPPPAEADRYNFDDFSKVIMTAMTTDRSLDVDDMCEKFFEALDFRRRGKVDSFDFGDFFRDNGDKVSARMMSYLVEAMDRSLEDGEVRPDDLGAFVKNLLADTSGNVNIDAMDPYSQQHGGEGQAGVALANPPGAGGGRPGSRQSSSWSGSGSRPGSRQADMSIMSRPGTGRSRIGRDPPAAPAADFATGSWGVVGGQAAGIDGGGGGATLFPAPAPRSYEDGQDLFPAPDVGDELWGDDDPEDDPVLGGLDALLAPDNPPGLQREISESGILGGK